MVEPFLGIPATVALDFDNEAQQVIRPLPSSTSTDEVGRYLRALSRAVGTRKPRP